MELGERLLEFDMRTVRCSFNTAALGTLCERLGPPTLTQRGEFAVWGRREPGGVLIKLWAWVAPGSRCCVVWWTRGAGSAEDAQVLLSARDVEEQAARLCLVGARALAS